MLWQQLESELLWIFSWCLQIKFLSNFAVFLFRARSELFVSIKKRLWCFDFLLVYVFPLLWRVFVRIFSLSIMTTPEGENLSVTVFSSFKPCCFQFSTAWRSLIICTVNKFTTLLKKWHTYWKSRECENLRMWAIWFLNYWLNGIL